MHTCALVRLVLRETRCQSNVNKIDLAEKMPSDVSLSD